MVAFPETMIPKRILYADDDRSYSLLVLRACEHLGHQVTLFPTTGAALAALSSAPKGWDMVITGYNRLADSSLADTKAMHDQYPHLMCAIVSNFISDGNISDANAAGIKLLSHKPTSLQQFNILIRQVVGQFPLYA